MEASSKWHSTWSTCTRRRLRRCTFRSAHIATPSTSSSTSSPAMRILPSRCRRSMWLPPTAPPPRAAARCCSGSIRSDETAGGLSMQETYRSTLPSRHRLRPLVRRRAVAMHPQVSAFRWPVWPRPKQCCCETALHPSGSARGWSCRAAVLEAARSNSISASPPEPTVMSSASGRWKYAGFTGVNRRSNA